MGRVESSYLVLARNVVQANPVAELVCVSRAISPDENLHKRPRNIVVVGIFATNMGWMTQNLKPGGLFFRENVEFVVTI